MNKLRNNLRKKIKEKPYLALSVPTILCFITFVTNFFSSLSDGKIDTNEYRTLLASADGFEVVILFIVMLALNNKKR